MNLETVFATMFTGLGVGVIVFILFVWIMARKLQLHVDSEVSGIMEKLAQERLIPLTVEVDHDQYFCYNSINQAFVCQGYNLKEIVERFRLRYPSKAAAIYDGDETAVRTLKKQMKDMDENFSSQ